MYGDQAGLQFQFATMTTLNNTKYDHDMSVHITMTSSVGCRKRKGSISADKGLVDTSDILVTNEVSLCPCTHLHVYVGENW